MSRYEEYRRPSRSTSTAQNNRQLRRYFCRGEVCQLPSLAGVGLWDSGKGGLARASAALGFALTGTPGLEESRVGLSEVQAWGYFGDSGARRSTSGNFALVFDPALRHIHSTW